MTPKDKDVNGQWDSQQTLGTQGERPKVSSCVITGDGELELLHHIQEKQPSLGKRETLGKIQEGKPFYHGISNGTLRATQPLFQILAPTLINCMTLGFFTSIFSSTKCLIIPFSTHPCNWKCCPWWRMTKSWPGLSPTLGIQLSLMPLSHDWNSGPTWLPLLLLMEIMSLIPLSLCNQFTS